MTENEIAKVIVDTAFQIHKRLGPELLESIYEIILAYVDLPRAGRQEVGVVNQFWFRTNSRRHLKSCKQLVKS